MVSVKGGPARPAQPAGGGRNRVSLIRVKRVRQQERRSSDRHRCAKRSETPIANPRLLLLTSPSRGRSLVQFLDGAPARSWFRQHSKDAGDRLSGLHPEQDCPSGSRSTSTLSPCRAPRCSRTSLRRVICPLAVTVNVMATAGSPGSKELWHFQRNSGPLAGRDHRPVAAKMQSRQDACHPDGAGNAGVHTGTAARPRSETCIQLLARNRAKGASSGTPGWAIAPAPTSRPGLSLPAPQVSQVPSFLRSQATQRLRQRPTRQDHRLPSGALHGVDKRCVVAQAAQPDDIHLAKLLGQPFLYPVIRIGRGDSNDTLRARRYPRLRRSDATKIRQVRPMGESGPPRSQARTVAGEPAMPSHRHFRSASLDGLRPIQGVVEGERRVSAAP